MTDHNTEARQKWIRGLRTHSLLWDVLAVIAGALALLLGAMYLA